MKSKKKVLLISILALSLSACASKKKDGKSEVVQRPDFSQQNEAVRAFEQANALFDDEDYEGAAKAYDKIMVAKPVSTLDGLIIFNSGLSYQMTGDCRKAALRYRKVIRFSQKRKAEPLTLRAKLRLSDAYACLGLVNRSMVLLSEIFKQRRKLAPEIGLAEIPAKLAAGYSRLGNRKMADSYFKIADKGLRILENTKQDAKKQNLMLSKTLFTMGDTSRVKFKEGDHTAYFRTIKTLQKYLLRSMAYQIEPWQEKAATQIVAAYERTWKLVDDVKPPKEFNKTRGSRAVKVERGKILQLALDSLRDLKQQKLPGKRPEGITQLFKRLERTRLKMRNYLVAEVPGSELTEEAKYLQGDKREGRTKSPNPILERKKKK